MGSRHPRPEPPAPAGESKDDSARADGPGAERLLANDGTPVVRARAGGLLARVALVGLGFGALACIRAPNENWSIYEIDPELVRLSAESGLFRAMPTCAPDQTIVIGDARLTLADAKDPFDLIILDAYSSDNVPVHLLTREAMALYRFLLRPDGAIVMNITNRNIALSDIVAASAQAADLRMLHKRDPATPDFNATFWARADIAALARDEKDFGALGPENGWTAPPLDPGFRTWTDDDSDIVGAILRHWR